MGTDYTWRWLASALVRLEPRVFRSVNDHESELSSGRGDAVRSGLLYKGNYTATSIDLSSFSRCFGLGPGLGISTGFVANDTEHCIGMMLGWRLECDAP